MNTASSSAVGPSTARRLAGKVVLVTGSAQGIGAEIGRRLALEGASLVLADRAEARVQGVAEECRALGAANCTAAVVDLSDPDSCTDLAKQVVAGGQVLHGLVNGAAIFSTITMKPFWEISVAEWDALMAVNLRGPWLLTSALLPGLRRAGGASVVNIGSDSVWQGREGYLHYVASKAGLLGVTFSMSHELGRDQIRVNTVSPGAVMTEVPRETVTEAQKETMLGLQALKRFAEPADVAAVTAYLLSDDASFVTGQTISVNGGLMHR